MILAVITLAVVDAASGDSANGNGTGPVPPSVFISEPPDRTIVRSSSFEISGGLGGSVVDIDVFIDGVDLGPARRGEESGDWRLPADAVSVAPGLHRISVRAGGEGGSDTAASWVFYDTAGLPFVIAVEPERTVYQQGDTSFADDPDLLLIGPQDSGVTLDLGTSAPSQIRASTNPRLSTGSLAKLDLDIVEDTPGDYPVVVRAVGPDGTAMEATHTVVIVGPPDTQAAVTEVPPEGTVKLLFDDFETDRGRWTTVMSGTNGSTDTVETAAGGGNPGGFRLMRHVLPATADGEANPSQITVVHLYGGCTWDPALDGALSHINYSEDRIEQEPPFQGAAVGALFIMEQDGTRYFVSLDDNNAFTNLAWETKSLDRLTPTDFSPAPGPDFSEAGGEMVFGILRSNTNRANAEIVVTSGLDNWTVELVGE